MSAPPHPTGLLVREEWADADFDIPDGVPLHAPSDREDDDEDWDLEMDLGPTGGPKVKAVVAGMVARSDTTQYSFAASASQMITIRPPIASLKQDDEDDEGVSTIKAADNISTLKPHGIPKQPLPQVIDEDFEDGFALPSDLTRLSLAPQSLNHRSSKNSLEWGDKDSSTSSSQSSDAYSTLGFANTSPHSNSCTSVSLPDTETEEEDDDLEGLVIPNALFESKQSARHLNKILETKKKTDAATNSVQVAAPNPEDDFEAGLIIEDDVDLSPSRLLTNSNSSQRKFARSSSHPPARPTSLRPPSRTKPDRSKSPSNPPPSSQRQLQKIRLSPTPSVRPPTRSQTFQSFGPPPPIPSPTPSPSSSFLTPKPGSLRGQKSHSGLKPPTPPSTVRKLTRKASLSVIESSQKQVSRTSVDLNANQAKLARYEEPTVASKAKSHKGSTRGMSTEYKVPPTRPCTPSSNPVALRLTMPTQSRTKSRPALSSLFASPVVDSPSTRSISPLPPLPRPPSSSALRASSIRVRPAQTPIPAPATPPPASAPKLIRKPKRLRTYGDGTELDGFDDLPLDQDKEGHYRVLPKGHGNRIPGQSFDKQFSKSASAGDRSAESRPGTIRRMKGAVNSLSADPAILAPATNTLRRTGGLDLSGRPVSKSVSDVLPKKRKVGNSPTKSPSTRRKPTLIRNLGGDAGPKVVGDMKYNPATQRWEGNDQVLREFDAAMGTSTRPALITPFASSTIGSPSGNFSNGARVVGNMYFDPQQMRWISTLPPDEEEPDVFANMADDEEDSDAWERKSGTIRASTNTGPRASDASSVTSSSDSCMDVRMPSPSPILPNGHSRSISDSGSDDRGSRASMHVGDVDEEFIEKCRQAEERHRTEMKGWKTSLSRYDPHQPPNMSHLYEIRALATRKY